LYEISESQRLYCQIDLFARDLIDLAIMLNITVEFGYSFDIIDFFFYVPDCKVIGLNTLHWFFIVLTCRHVICVTVLFIKILGEDFNNV